MTFWLKHTSIGKLHFLLGRNDDIRNRHAPFEKFKRISVHFNRSGRHIFFGIRIGVRFLHIDLNRWAQ